VSFILVYTLILLIPLTLAVALRYLIIVPRRECLQCDREVAVTVMKCRHCGYRYTFEDREIMRVMAESRRRTFESEQRG
jgi:hypothetical protein